MAYVDEKRTKYRVRRGCCVVVDGMTNEKSISLTHPVMGNGFIIFIHERRILLSLVTSSFQPVVDTADVASRSKGFAKKGERGKTKHPHKTNERNNKKAKMVRRLCLSRLASAVTTIKTRKTHLPMSHLGRRSIVSLIQKPTIPSSSSSSSSFLADKHNAVEAQEGRRALQSDLDHAVHMVRSHDPAGYLPGRLLPTSEMQVTYYAVRSFWVETGLRFGSTANVPPDSSPAGHLTWWQEGIEKIYDDNDKIGTHDIDERKYRHNQSDHPTLRLLSYLHDKHQFTKCHFEDILKGRFRDLDLKQYPTLDSLEEHATWSCGSLSQLVLESNGMFEKKNFPIIHQAAKFVGASHGLTNALRTSIPVISTTGKLVIPQELCDKYNVKSPRYLLSALGQGDKECKRALRMAVQDIVERARDYLNDARKLRPDILTEFESSKHSTTAISTSTSSKGSGLTVLLPGLASETFLNRLEEHDFDLTNRDLRNVHWLEHVKCSTRIIHASYQQQY